MLALELSLQTCTQAMFKRSHSYRYDTTRVINFQCGIHICTQSNIIAGKIEINSLKVMQIRSYSHLRVDNITILLNNKTPTH